MKPSYFKSFSGIVLAWCMLILFPISAQEISTQLSPKQMMIGDTVGLYITVKVPENTQVDFLAVPDSLNDFIEVLGQKVDTVLEKNEKRYIQHLVLTGFDSGEFLINSLPVKIQDSIYQSTAQTLTINDMPVDTLQQNLFPIKSIETVEISWWERNQKYLLYMLVGLVLVLVILLIIYLYFKEKRKNKYVSNPLLPPYEEALQNLKKLDQKNYIASQNFKAYYTDLSFILKRYFSRRFTFDGMALLSDDFATYLANKEYLEPQEVTEMKAFLKDADLAKYAKTYPTDDWHEKYRTQVAQWIEQTKPLIEPENDTHE